MLALHSGCFAVLPTPPLPTAQVLAIMDESIQVYSPELLQNRIAILR